MTVTKDGGRPSKVAGRASETVGRISEADWRASEPGWKNDERDTEDILQGGGTTGYRSYWGRWPPKKHKVTSKCRCTFSV